MTKNRQKIKFRKMRKFGFPKHAMYCTITSNYNVNNFIWYMPIIQYNRSLEFSGGFISSRGLLEETKNIAKNL